MLFFTTDGAVFFFMFLAFCIFSYYFRLKRAECIYQKERSQYRSGFTALSWVFGVLAALNIIILGFLCLADGPAYYTVASPDSRHELVVEEDSFLLAGGGCIYQKVNFLFMKQIGGYSTDDGYRPGGNYAITWYDDGLEFSCSEIIWPSKGERIYYLK